MVPPPLPELLHRFGRTDIAFACAQPDGAYANCLAVSAACAAWLRARGVPCGLLKMTGRRRPFADAVGRWPYCDPAGFTHWTVAVDGQSVDWSARQFEPAADWPEVLPVGALAGRWHAVERWACERCERLVIERRHLELAPATLAAEHRARARDTAGRGPFPDPRHDGDVWPLAPLCEHEREPVTI